MSTREWQLADRRRSVWSGLAIGVGAMAAVDEIVFHQLLSWHHFYDRASSDVALLSDGILQATYLVVLVGGLFLFADLRRDHAVDRRALVGAGLLGSGGFQLLDGLVDHKLLDLHQIRYVDDVWPYDLAWNGAALVLMAVGAYVLWRAPRTHVPRVEHVDR